MNPKQLVKLSNVIGIFAILLLMYWVFIFVTIEVFGLKIFRENLTQSFYMSILGILALMFGALMLNMMFNLTRIAQKHNQDEGEMASSGKLGWAMLVSFPVLLLLLFGGDYLTSRKKEKLLVHAAQSIMETHPRKSGHLVNYQFDENWIVETSDILMIWEKTDRNFPHVSILAQDQIEGEPVILEFNSRYYGSLADSTNPRKVNFIQQTTAPEREYLNSVFSSSNTDYRYSSHDGKYELFYPFVKGNKKVVVYFSEYQRYGKIGS